jgi:Trypsin-co-occurring domain 1
MGVHGNRNLHAPNIVSHSPDDRERKLAGGLDL